jgi:hypothetical protein
MNLTADTLEGRMSGSNPSPSTIATN